MKTNPFPQIILWLILIASPLEAICQTINDADLQNKYWSYRDRFRKHFTKIGSGRGESQGIATIHYEGGCPLYNQYNTPAAGMITFGDVLASQGEHLGFLSTEYHLLKQAGKDLTGVKNEIYFVLQAIERADLLAEKYYVPGSSGVLNGFFVKCDIPAGFYEHWEDLGDPIGTQSSGWSQGRKAYSANPIGGVPHYYDKNNSEIPIVGEPCTLYSPEQGIYPADKSGVEMSQDQAMGLLVGIRFVQKFVDHDLVVQPRSTDSPMNLYLWSKVLASRVLDYITQNHDNLDIPDVTFQVFGSQLTALNSGNYVICNPTTGDPVHLGWEAFMYGYGFEKMGELVTDIDYPGVNLDFTDGAEGIALVLDALFVKFGVTEELLNGWGIWPVLPENEQWWRNLWNHLDRIGLHDDFDGHDVRGQMLLWLGAASNSWSYGSYGSLAAHNDMPWFRLVYAVLNDVSVNDKLYYANLLNGAPETGPYKPSASSINFPWNKVNIFSMPNRDFNDGAYLPGEYNGMDYMFLHNLYRIAFASQISDPVNPAFIPKASTIFGTLNTYRGQAEFWPTGQIINSGYTVTTPNRFPEYINDFGIHVTEYLTFSDNRNYGNLHVKGNLTLANGKLTVYNTGKIDVEPTISGFVKSFIVGKDGVLELLANSEVHISNGSRLLVDVDGTLIIHPGAKIILDGSSAVLEVKGKIVLENNTTFSITGGSQGRGYLKFNMPDHNSAGIQCGSNCKVELIGNGKTDRILEITHEWLVAEENMQHFLIKNAKVTMGGDAVLALGSPYELNNITMESLPGALKHRGVHVFGDDHTIQLCDFKDGLFGIRSRNYVFGKKLKIDACNFENCDIGLQMEGPAPLELTSCVFTGNNIALNGIEQIGSSMIKDCYFYNNLEKAINLKSNLYDVEVLYRPYIYNSPVGVYHEGNNVSAFCGNIGSPVGTYSVGIMSAHQAKLDMSSAVNYPSGYMNFASDISLYSDFSGQVLLDEGNNTLKARFYAWQGYHNETFVHADKNFWDNVGNPPNNLNTNVYNITAYSVLPSGGFSISPALISDAAPLSVSPNYSSLCTSYPVKSVGVTGSIDPGSDMLLNTPNYQTVPLTTAVTDILDKLYPLENADINQVIGLCKEVLLVDYSASMNNEIKVVLDLVYQKMAEAVSFGINSGAINLDPAGIAISPRLLDIMSVQDHFINLYLLSPNTQDFVRYYKFRLDHALTNRVAYKHDAAITELNNMLLWLPADLAAYVDYKKCYYSNEWNMLTNASSLLSKMNFVGSGCISYQTPNPLPQLFSSHLDNSHQQANEAALNQGIEKSVMEIKQSVAASGITIYPNPACFLIKVSLEVSARSYEIFSANGAKVTEGKLNSSDKVDIDLDLSAFSDGIYFIRIVGADRTYVERFVVKK